VVVKPGRTGFVCYSRDDSVLVDRFIDVMRPRCGTQRDVELRLWSDRAIVAGAAWMQEIGSALADADFGLVCVSPGLLASSFVTSVELPALLRGGRLTIPFALKPLDLDELDLNGIEALQVFHLRRPGESRRRSFQDCRGVNVKRFCDELVGEIVQSLSAVGRLA
jgi:hypothetical protein